MHFSPFDLQPQIAYKPLSCLFLFFIWCYSVALRKLYKVFFYWKKKKSGKRIYLFFTLASKPLLVLAFLKALYDVRGTPFPVSVWEEKTNYHTLLDSQDRRKTLVFSCISNSRQTESIERLRLEVTSVGHLVQPIPQRRSKFRARSGCSGHCPIKFLISPQMEMKMKNFKFCSVKWSCICFYTMP